MSGVAFVKVIALIGIIVVLTTTVTGSTPPSWTSLQTTLQTGIKWPTFWNPFTQETIRDSAYADTPFTLGVGGDAGVVGCNNTTTERALCLSTPDGDTSYVTVVVNMSDPGIQILSGFFFNYSNPQFKTIEGAWIREVTLTFQCKTVTNTSSIMGFYVKAVRPHDPVEIYTPKMFCPKGSDYQTVSHTMNMPNGFTLPPFIPAVNFLTQFELYTNSSLTLQGETGNKTFIHTGNPIARFTYFRIDIAYTQESNCTPPDGAWFPFLDNVACAIVNFASFVWKGIQFIASGIAFIVMTIATVVIFVGIIVVSMFLGIVEVYATLFSLGAPSPLQEVINVIAIASAAFLVYQVVMIFRGGYP